MYMKGDGVGRSEQEAVRLFRRAAEGGSPDAQARLGELYERGQGVPQNNYHAYLWYSAAVRGGNGEARTGQDRAGKLLQPAEIQQAKRLVDEIVRKDK
jgi:TPR repeat protein